MMDEMAKTLARRRAQAESHGDATDDPGRRNHGVNGSSPSKDTDLAGNSKARSSSDLGQMNGGMDHFDVERLKQDILVEIRKEVQKMKLDIIDAIRMELNRR